MKFEWNAVSFGTSYVTYSTEVLIVARKETAKGNPQEITTCIRERERESEEGQLPSRL